MAIGKCAIKVIVLTTAMFVLNVRLFAQEAGVERFQRVAAVLSTLEKDRKLCTAFFVSHKDKMLMVAAKHASLETNITTEILLPSKGANQRLFKLADIAKVSGANPWIVHKSADLAMCELDLSKLSAPLAEQVRSMSITVANCESVPPRRSRRIECIGFSLGLGVESEQVSPLATTFFVASDALTFEGTWGKESVFYASPAVGGGASGGLVTLYERNLNTCRVVGVCIGFNGDHSGAKLARIVPASVLREFIESDSE